MPRITQKDIEFLANRINDKSNSPHKPWEDGNANIGCYHISYAYGGAALHRMSNEHGGVRDIFGHHMPKKELYNRMQAYLSGLYDA